MMIPSKVKIIAGLAVLFAAGGVCGWFLALRYTERHFVELMNYHSWSSMALKGMDKHLGLTPEQEKEARVILDETVEDMVGNFRRIGGSLVQSHQRIGQILTPEQIKKHEAGFAEFRTELREKFNIELPSDPQIPNPPPPAPGKDGQ